VINEDLAPDRRIILRIGVSLADVIVEGDEGVIIAARLEALAELGGIRISGAVLDQVRNKEIPYGLDNFSRQSCSGGGVVEWTASRQLCLLRPPIGRPDRRLRKFRLTSYVFLALQAAERFNRLSCTTVQRVTSFSIGRTTPTYNFAMGCSSRPIRGKSFPAKIRA
jgi:hypothetical protein